MFGGDLVFVLLIPLLVFVVFVVAVLAFMLIRSRNKRKDRSSPQVEGESLSEKSLPYRLRDDFLSAAEQSFFRILQANVTDWALVAPKVNLADLFYPAVSDFGERQGYRSRIDRKHVDFLLADPKSLTPLLGIELDDSSHNRPDRQERDEFVDAVFEAAGLPLARIPVQASYNTRELADHLKKQAGVSESAGPSAENMTSPLSDKQQEQVEPLPDCPKCGQPMVLRTVSKGQYAGRQFWGCSAFPQCRGYRPVVG